MRGPVLEQEAFLPGTPERGPMRVGRAEVRVPRIEVRVEVQQRNGTVSTVHRPEQRQCDRVVTADRQEMGRPTQRLVGTGLDLRDRLLDVERVARDVSGIGHLLHRERLHVERGMVGTEEPGPRSDALGPEAGPGAVGHAAVEGDPEDGDVADVDVLAARESCEGRGPRVARDHERVERPHRWGTLAGRSLRVRIVGHRGQMLSAGTAAGARLNGPEPDDTEVR